MQSSGNNIVAQRLLYKYKFTLYACSKLYLSVVQSNLCTLFSVYITIKKKSRCLLVEELSKIKNLEVLVEQQSGMV